MNCLLLSSFNLKACFEGCLLWEVEPTFQNTIVVLTRGDLAPIHMVS